MNGLSHVDDDGRPQMVDVGGKAITRRSTVATARLRLPAHVAATLRSNGYATAKGPVFQTAIIAGTLGAKRTHELIPLCHPLGLDGCSIEIALGDDDCVGIRCSVSVEHRTGVEMEALTGASVAALTIYDMCKALSHEIVIEDIRLVAKHGGRRDVGTPS